MTEPTPEQVKTIRREFVREIERQWSGGTGHRDGDKWVSIQQLKEKVGLAGRHREATDDAEEGS